VSQVELLSEVRHQEFPDEWYDVSTPDHFWFQWRMAAVSRALADAAVATARPLRALDVGCGSGILARQLEEATAWTVDGTDLNLPALERCGPRRGRTFYYDVTEERQELLGAYDVAILFDILEHLPEPRAVLTSSLRHLKPGGTLLINVPALPTLTSEYDRAAGHLRRYTLDSLEAAACECGLRTRLVRYWGLSLVPLLLARKALLLKPDPRTIDRGFRPPLPGMNSALVALMRLELALVHEPWLGTSALYLGVKDR
jgi:SAM-dependent methyltransferase